METHDFYLLKPDEQNKDRFSFANWKVWMSCHKWFGPVFCGHLCRTTEIVFNVISFKWLRKVVRGIEKSLTVFWVIFPFQRLQWHLSTSALTSCSAIYIFERLSGLNVVGGPVMTWHPHPWFESTVSYHTLLGSSCVEERITLLVRWTSVYYSSSVLTAHERIIIVCIALHHHISSIWLYTTATRLYGLTAHTPHTNCTAALPAVVIYPVVEVADIGPPKNHSAVCCLMICSILQSIINNCYIMY